MALELGHNEQPCRATHEDISDELSCAPQTASNHLQKAEEELVNISMDEIGPNV